MVGPPRLVPLRAVGLGLLLSASLLHPAGRGQVGLLGAFRGLQGVSWIGVHILPVPYRVV